MTTPNDAPDLSIPCPHCGAGVGEPCVGYCPANVKEEL